jgi:hypothetical protein
MNRSLALMQQFFVVKMKKLLSGHVRRGASRHPNTAGKPARYYPWLGRHNSVTAPGKWTTWMTSYIILT